MVRAERFRESFPAIVPVVSDPRMWNSGWLTCLARVSLSSPRFPAIQDFDALVGARQADQVSALTAIDGAFVRLVDKVETVVTTVAMKERTGERTTNLNGVSTIERGVIQEATTTVNSGVFGNTLQVHRVIAQVAGHDSVGDGAGDGNVISALTAIDGGTQSSTTDINGVVATIAMRVASAGSSTDVDGVSTIRRGGIGGVTTVDSGIIEAVV